MVRFNSLYDENTRSGDHQLKLSGTPELVVRLLYDRPLGVGFYRPALKTGRTLADCVAE